MLSLGDWILIGLACIAIAPVVVIFVESLMALLPRSVRQLDKTVPRPPCAILIPAHNEEQGIAATTGALRDQVRAGDRIVVIADNCSDETAQRARGAGAEAIERTDAERRGKGYALAFGLEHLAANPPEIVVLIDADTHAHPEALERVVRESARCHGPVQGVFTDAPQSRGPREQWSAFALTFKNLVRPLGLHRLGLPCLLTGSGMAFPWAVIRKAELGTGNIVEDMKLGIDLAIAGHPARFCPDARFDSSDAPNIEAAGKRRTRWEHGHMATLLSQVPRLLLAGLVRLKPRLLALACELAVPPLSLLFIGITVLVLICFAWNLSGGSPLPLWILGIGTIGGVLGILAVWGKFGRKLLSPKILFLLPIYVLWKVPIYLKLMIAPERKWIRTERNSVP
ncbi:MAG: glycosyltransferase family 2 protein [Planctomycetes bacterium]|nr:glycosyltransferase family 2 protein [Planctomycetota bacterium]